MSEYTPTTSEVKSKYRLVSGLGMVDAHNEFDRWLAEVERAAAEKALRDAAEWIDNNFQSLPRWNETWKNGTRNRDYERGSVDATCDVRDWLFGAGRREDA